MGHLINPTSTRLGKFMYWEDFWYVDHIYYPEYLHSLLKMKLYLIYFFGLSLFEDNGFLYSHFDFVHQSKVLMVRIYLYYAGFMRVLGDFFDELRWYFRIEFISEIQAESFSRKNLFLFGHRFNRWKIFKRYPVILSVFLFFWMTSGNFFGVLEKQKNFKVKKKQKKALASSSGRLVSFERLKFMSHSVFDRFFRKLLSLNIFTLRNLFKTKAFSVLSKVVRRRFLFFFSFLICLSRHIKMIGGVCYLNDVWERLLMSFFSFLYLKPFFKIIRSYLLLLFYYMFPSFYGFLNLVFYLTSNESVTAKFVSRFVAFRLKFGYTFKEVVDPVRFDLAHVMGATNTLYKSPLLIAQERFLEFKSLAKGVFRRLFLSLVSIYHKLWSLCFRKRFIWLVEEFFIWHYQMRLNLNKNLNRLVGLSRAHIKRCGFFCLFFNMEFLLANSDSNQFRLLNQLNDLLFVGQKFSSLSLWYYRLCLSLHSLYFVLFRLGQKRFFDKPVVISFIYLNRYLGYNYGKILYGWLYQHNKMNKLRLRSDKLNAYGKHILGFKIHISGRLSRRDRVSDVWCIYGKVPANRFDAKIDYAFYTVPLANSATRIKVWIHRGSLVFSWHLKII